MSLQAALAVLDKHFDDVRTGRQREMSSPTYQAYKLIREHKPQTQEDFEKLFKLTYLGKGCSRNAYSIEGTSLVVKIEMCGDTEDTNHEVECYELLRRNRKALPYLMQILYHAPAILVVPRYEHVDDGVNARKAQTTIRETFTMAGVQVADLHYKNIMKDVRGNIRCSDMGHFTIRKDKLA